jgi:hypothetical protein
MRIDRIDGHEYWTAESLDDLRGWEIITVQPWKEGVSRLHCCRAVDSATTEFRMIYCRTSILHGTIEVETVQ